MDKRNGSHRRWPFCRDLSGEWRWPRDNTKWSVVAGKRRASGGSRKPCIWNVVLAEEDEFRFLLNIEK